MSSTKKQVNQTERMRRTRSIGSRNVSLGDVALHAGVSTATVSRVLNYPEKVAKKSRDLVNASIDVLGYIPDGAAQALASRHSRTIGAIVPTLDNALFAAGIQSFQRRLKQSGYTLIVASHEYDLDEELNEVKTLLRQGVDGLLLIGSKHHEGLEDLLVEKSIPHINGWTRNAESPYPHIGFDNFIAAKNITRYLLDLGHTEFGVIVGKTRNNDRASGRLEGIREAIESSGLVLAEENILQRSHSIKQGRDAMRVLLQHHCPPTAVVCGNDILAIGAIAECQSAGIDIPSQISITGFDDLDISSQLIPALTTVRVPSSEMGEKAAEFLVSAIKQEATELHTVVETRLMIRDTTAPFSKK